jgi:uncharacterized protein (DUF4415 family)
VLRVTRAFAVVALVGVAAGCGGSHSATPPTTEPISTLPKKITSLVVQNFPESLTGSVTFVINRKQGKPKQPGSWKRNYTVKLDNLVLHLSRIEGKGDKRRARYNLASSDESFTGYEDLTNSKCKTTHIVWAGSGRKPTGTVEVFSPKFDGEVGFVFLVPQRGKTLTRPCNASSGGQRNTVIRTARISGNANLKLTPSKSPTQRFSIGIEIQSSTAGQQASGGYTINGALAPAAGAGRPVQLCRETGNGSCRRV